MTEINVTKEDFELKTKVHILPCKIMHTGPAEVESYFDSCILKMETNENGNFLLVFTAIKFYFCYKHLAYETALRGRPLNGVISKLAESKIGLIVEPNSTNDSNCTWKTTGSFNLLYSWQFDEPKVSLTNDPFTTALNDWTKISEIVSMFSRNNYLFLISFLKIYRYTNKMRSEVNR